MKRSNWADQWWQKARHVLDAARVMHREGFFDTCAFLSQQAVEKAVKALWIDIKQTDPPRVHAVGPMAIQLGAGKQVVSDINDVVGDYMASRYPDATMALPASSYTDSDAQQRLVKADRVLSWVQGQWEN